MATWFNQELPEEWPDEPNQTEVGPEPSTSASGIDLDHSGSLSSADSNRATTAVQPTVAIQAGNTGETQQWHKALRPEPQAPHLESMFHAETRRSNSTQRTDSSLSSQGDFSDTLPPDGPINRRGAYKMLGPQNTYLNQCLDNLQFDNNSIDTTHPTKTRTRDGQTRTIEETFDQSEITNDPEVLKRLKADGRRFLDNMPEKIPQRMSSRISDKAKKNTSLSELEQQLTKGSTQPTTTASYSGFGSTDSSNGSTLEELISTSTSSRQRLNEVATLGIGETIEPETSSSGIDLDIEPSALRQSFYPSDASTEHRKSAPKSQDSRHEGSLLFDTTQSQASPFSSVNSQYPPHPQTSSSSIQRGPPPVSADEYSRQLKPPSSAPERRQGSGSSGAAVDSIRANWSNRRPPQPQVQTQPADVTQCFDGSFDSNRAFDPTPVSSRGSDRLFASSSPRDPRPPSSHMPAAPRVRSRGLPLLPESSILDRDLSYSATYDTLARLLRAQDKTSEEVDLAGKSLDRIDGLDKFLSNVSQLWLSNNHLTTVEGLPTSLTWLAIDHNILGSLCTFPSAFISTLDISHNRLTNLKPLANLRALTDLNISNNMLENLHGLRGLPALKTLNVSGNKLVSLDIRLDYLEMLNASNNQIVAARLDTPQLEFLHLDNNRLINLAPVPSVRELSIQNNNVIVDFAGWSCLEKLSYDGNSMVQNFADTRPIEVSWVPPLASTNGHHDVIKGFTPISLQNARDICLGGPLGRELVHAPYQFVVQHLDLKECGLDKLPANFARHFPVLLSLNLADNNLRDDAAPILGALKGLRRLSLYGNKFQDIKSVLRGLQPLSSGLEVLDLRKRTTTKPYTEILQDPNAPHPPRSYRNLVTSVLRGLGWLDGELLHPLGSTNGKDGWRLLYDGLGHDGVAHSGEDYSEHTQEDSRINQSMPNLSVLSLGDHSFARSHSTPSSKSNSKPKLTPTPKPESQERPKSTSSGNESEWNMSEWVLRASTFDVMRALTQKASVLA